MCRCLTIILVFILPFFCFGQNGFLVIKNVNVIDVINNKVIKGRTVIIEGNKIISVGDKSVIPKQATIVDGNGKYLIPGLWDMHTHTLRETRAQYFFPLFIANGVTGIRDMASDMSLDDINKLRDDLGISKIIGPRLGAITGKVLDGPPQPDTLLFTYPSDAVAAKQLVRSYKQQRVDFIKVYNMLSKDIYLAIAEEAKKENIPFAGHVPFSVTATEASDLGQRSIEHLSDLLISCSENETALRKRLSISTNATQGSKNRMEVNFDAAKTYDKRKALALCSVFIRNQTWQCLTLRNLQTVSAGADIELLMADTRLKYFPNSLKNTWKRNLLNRITGDSLQRNLFFQQTLQLVADMQHAGVRILAGTDLANPFLMPGFSLHDELKLMVKAGLTTFEALQTATINPAEFLHLDKILGSVEQGKLADLVLLDANPLDNIGNTEKIYAVIRNGRLLLRPDLDALLKRVEELVLRL